MLKKVMLALALMLSSASAMAANSLAESNLQVTWVAENNADAYAFTGEYVANNNFFVGGGYAWADADYGNANLFNFNLGAYFPIAKFEGNSLYGKVGLGYTSINADWDNYNTVDARIGVVYEGDVIRATVGTSTSFADIQDGYGIASYNFDGSLGWKFLETWETGAQFSLGDVDTYGLYVRYNFM